MGGRRTVTRTAQHNIKIFHALAHHAMRESHPTIFLKLSFVYKRRVSVSFEHTNRYLFVVSFLFGAFHFGRFVNQRTPLKIMKRNFTCEIVGVVFYSLLCDNVR